MLPLLAVPPHPIDGGILRFVVRDAARRPAPCHVRVVAPDGRPVQPPGLPFWHDAFAIGGDATLALPAGRYRWSVDRGPEWTTAAGETEVRPGKSALASATLRRTADLRRQGWRCADMHVHRPPADAALLLEAADLDFLPTITWWNATNAWANAPLPSDPRPRFRGSRWADLMAGEDERDGGALLFFGLDRPLPIQTARRDHPCSVEYLRLARRHGVAWVEIEKPFWWDTPLWLAEGVDSVEALHNHLWREGGLDNEAWGRPRDRAAFPPPQGVGLWTQELLYRMLECGLSPAFTAGSASGVLPNPVGYNRVYAHTGGDASADGWWRALRAGRTFCTNGPLLLARVDGRLPGATLRGPRSVRVTVRLLGSTPVARVEVVQNGVVVASAPPPPSGAEELIAAVRFDEPGWLLVRAIGAEWATFRMATTAPWRLSVPGKPARVSRRAVAFFAEWVEERAAQLLAPSAPTRASAAVYVEEARRFWRYMALRANAD